MPAPLDSSRPVRWGILGAGGIAATVGADIAASGDSEVVAVGARDADRAAALAGRLGAPRSYGSYAELVADDALDVVYVATTHAQHHEHALLALRAGRSVLVEKAFTLTAAQAREVVAEADTRDLFCMEAMWMRLNPLVRRARGLVAEGAIGEPVAAFADHGQRFDYDPQHRLFDLSAGGGALLDLGVYSCAFAWMFLGAPDAVSAHGRLSPTGSDLLAAAQWNYADGRLAQIWCTTESATPNEGTVIGTHGSIRLASPFYFPDRLELRVDGDVVATETDRPGGNGYLPQIAEVERCLRAGRRQSDLVTWDDTIGIMALMDDVRSQIGVRYPADDMSTQG